MKKFMILLLAALFAQGCTTISFVTDERSDRTYYSEWHHDWLYLIEGSDPVDMSQRCKGAPWKTVTTTQTFVQGLVAGLTSGLYTPHGVEYACVKASTNGSSNNRKK
jgi:Bor protein